MLEILKTHWANILIPLMVTGISNTVFISYANDKNIAVQQETIKTLVNDVSVLKTDVTQLKVDVAVIKTEINGIKTEINGMKTEISGIKNDIRSLRESDQRQTEMLMEILKNTRK